MQVVAAAAEVLDAVLEEQRYRPGIAEIGSSELVACYPCPGRLWAARARRQWASGGSLQCATSARLAGALVPPPPP